VHGRTLLIFRSVETRSNRSGISAGTRAVSETWQRRNPLPQLLGGAPQRRVAQLRFEFLEHVRGDPYRRMLGIAGLLIAVDNITEALERSAANVMDCQRRNESGGNLAVRNSVFFRWIFFELFNESSSSFFSFFRSGLAVLTWTQRVFAPLMKSTVKCKDCEREFAPDRRNQWRQAYCPTKSCQRRRRTLQQRLRRQKEAARPKRPESPFNEPEGGRRLQTASVISEADFRAENPVIIGLISMLTGTIDVEQIERTYRQLLLRGMQIIAKNSDSLSPNAQILNIFEGLKRDRRGSK